VLTFLRRTESAIRKKKKNNVDIGGVIQQREVFKETGSGFLEKPSYIYCLISYTVKCS
jgi:hypothetical protein